MYQVRRIVVVVIMLFGFVVLSTGMAAPVLAATALADSGPGSYCCTGEFNCGTTCPPTSTQPKPVSPGSTSCGSGGHFQPRQCGPKSERELGFEAGKEACETGGSQFPPLDASWQFKMGYREGYNSVLAGRGK